MQEAKCKQENQIPHTANPLMKFADYPFPSIYDAPFKHQIETVKFLLTNPKDYNLSTMGTGKTLSALWAADFLMVNKKLDKVLIIAPLSTLSPVWYDSIFHNLPHRKRVILHGPKDKRIELLNKPYDFYIINHDGIKVIEQQIKAQKFKLIIIDELTAFKNYSTDRTKCMVRLAKPAQAVWGLTGEPTAQSPLDAFGQAKVVTPHNPNLPKYYGSFRDLVTQKDPFDEFNYIPRDGWENTIAKILSPAIRYELRDCIDMPPTVYEEREVPMSKDQSKAYKEMRNHYITEIKEKRITASNAGVKYLKLLQISAGVVYSEDQDPVRLDCKKKINELTDIFYQGGKQPVIVFIAFREAIKMVEEALSTKFRVKVMTGDTSAMARGQMVRDFQEGLIDFFLLQPRVASHGLTLTRSNIAIWYTPYPSNEIYKQANARIIRPGQKRPQLIVRLYSSESEKKLYEGLDTKSKLSALLLKLIKEM